MQAFVQLPQCALCVCRSAPPVHADHALQLPSPLQVRVSVPRLQVPHDCEVGPALQGQLPAWHATPAAQTWPQTPQFLFEVCRSAPPVQADHAFKLPSALHVRVCVPALHVPHGWVVAPLHEQVPAWQPMPAAQAWPHAPQFALSVCTFAPPAHADQAPQVPSVLHVRVCVPALQVPHDCEPACPEPQTPPHFPALHVWLAVQGDPESFHCPSGPQLWGCLPLQCSPEGAQTPPHWPPTHVWLLAQAWPHAPQLFSSVVTSVHVPPHAVLPGSQLTAQVPEPLQSGVASVQAFPQLPQCAAIDRSASHPSLESPLQSPHPAAHDEAGNAHRPASQLVAPVT